MKKIKFDKKLSLNKETIAKLNDEQMNGVKGGAATWTLIACNRTHKIKCASEKTCFCPVK